MPVILAAALAGCASGFVSEHPVSQAAPPLKPGVHRLQDVDVRPVPIHEVEPEDPPELGSLLTGKATVVFTVGTNGKVTDAAVLQADDVLFGEAAVKAVLKWRFRPAEIKSAPVACRMTLPFTFASPYDYYPGGIPGAPSVPDNPPDDSRPTALSPQ